MDRHYSQDRCGLETRSDGKPMLVGYAAVFYKPGDAGTQYQLRKNSVERVSPLAFRNAIESNADVLGLFNHDPSLILGRTSSGTMRLSVDNRGLRYEIDLPDTQLGRDVAEHVRRGDLAGSSFSFNADKETWRSESGVGEVRTLESVTLGDVGPVTGPAYKATSVGVRSDADCRDALASLATWKKSQLDKRNRDKRLRDLRLSAGN